MQETHTPSLRRKHRTILLVCVVITSIIYIGWRIFFTIPFRFGLLATILGIALVVAETIAVVEALDNYRNMQAADPPEKPEIPAHMYPDVDILVTTHSEDTNLLYKTLNGCIHMKYPDKKKIHIYLCDDTNRPEMQQLAQQMGVGYFGMENNTDAKAGNLNNALAQTDSPLVVTFDADMIPRSEFLMETVPFFSLPKMIKEDGIWRERTPEEIDEKEKIGFIQTPQSFYNADLFQFNLYAEKNIPNEQDYFFREINIGRNRTNSVVYAGSNTVISREALDEVGGIRTGTITEDFATGLDIQTAGYTTYAISKVVAHGLAPKDYKSLIKQRQRWARGCVQVLRSFRFLSSSLPLRAKASYMICFLYWWTFFRRFIYILSPILFMVFGIVVVDCSIWELLLIWLPSYLIYNRANKVMSGNIRTVRWSNIVDAVMFPYLLIPVIAETFGLRMRKFVVTPKGKTSSRNSHIKYAIPHMILAGLSVAGLVFCINDLIVWQNYGGIIIFYWLVVNLYTLLNAIVLIAGRINYRSDERFYASVPVTLDTGTVRLEGETADLSENGIAVLLEKTEYLPYEDSILVELSYKDYCARLMAKVLHVQQVGKVWKYSMKITEITESNRQQYLQIVFDRDHTLPNIIESNLRKDTMSTFKGSVSKPVSSNRKLPRIPMNVTLPTASGGQVEIINYNYEYILLNSTPILEEMLTILWDEGLELHCERIGAQQQGASVLYRVENWQELAAMPSFRERVFALSSAEGSSEPPMVQEVSVSV
ncbi:MAG: glycosyltransferase family 2 protein [Christensenellales bacterium]|jgi:cellulose synthase (UDP-forming)